jgi:RNA polymerase-binding transcription factor DksA
MTTEKIAYFKQKLLEKRAQIEQDLSAFAHKDATGDFQGNYEDLGYSDEDNTTETINYNRDLEVERTMEQIIHQIDRALKRIDDGTYGKDIHTGKEISEARLEVLPEAETAL